MMLQFKKNKGEDTKEKESPSEEEEDYEDFEDEQKKTEEV